MICRAMPVVLLVLGLDGGCSAAHSPLSGPAPTRVLGTDPTSSVALETRHEVSMQPTAQDEAALQAAHREMMRAMLGARTDQLGGLLDDAYVLTHMTGRRQSKRDWLVAIDAGEMRYHAAKEEAVEVEVAGDTATVVSRSVVTATIYGARGTWNLQLNTAYARRGADWTALSTLASTY